MKNLVRKELLLTFNPLLLIFVVGLTFLAAIPSYPKFIGLFYIYACYPIIFIGVNKGQNSNDVFYSLTLPVERKDIVKARLISLAILHAAMFVMQTIYFFVGLLIEKSIPPEDLVTIGFTNNAYLTMCGFSLISLGVLNLTFLPLFYRDAKSITASMIVAGLVFSIVLMVLNLALPLGFPAVSSFFDTCDFYIHIITFVIGFIIYTILNGLTYFISVKKFEKVDF